MKKLNINAFAPLSLSPLLTAVAQVSKIYVSLVYEKRSKIKLFFAALPALKKFKKMTVGILICLLHRHGRCPTRCLHSWEVVIDYNIPILVEACQLPLSNFIKPMECNFLSKSLNVSCPVLNFIKALNN